MQEYTINVREDGTAVIARDKWNPDHSMEAMDNKPFLFEVGQKVVDIFSNVVTIKEIIKHKPSKPGCCPEWNLLVEENGNCYRYTEIAGIYVREISAREFKGIVREDSLGVDDDLEEHLTWFLREYYNYDYPKQYKEGTGSSAMPHIVEAAIHFANWRMEQIFGCNTTLRRTFELGKKAAIDKETLEEVYAHLDGIMDNADRMTSGNFMHHKNATKLSAKIIKNRLQETFKDK